MAVKVLSICIVGFSFVAAILAGGDLRAFLDVPSALFVGSSWLHSYFYGSYWKFNCINHHAGNFGVFFNLFSFSPVNSLLNAC